MGQESKRLSIRSFISAHESLRCPTKSDLERAFSDLSQVSDEIWPCRIWVASDFFHGD
jgi:hypothetical protein